MVPHSSFPNGSSSVLLLPPLPLPLEKEACFEFAAQIKRLVMIIDSAMAWLNHHLHDHYHHHHPPPLRNNLIINVVIIIIIIIIIINIVHYPVPISIVDTIIPSPPLSPLPPAFP